MAAIVLFFFFLAAAFLWPEYLPYFSLSYQSCLLIIMDLISFMLLLAFFQTRLSLPWRVFCIIASFFVQIEATMMLDIWR